MEVDEDNAGSSGNSAQSTTTEGVLSTQDNSTATFTTMFSPVGMMVSTLTQPLLPDARGIFHYHRPHLPTGMRGTIAARDATLAALLRRRLGVESQAFQRPLPRLVGLSDMLLPSRSRPFARRLLAAPIREHQSTESTGDASSSRGSEDDQWISDPEAEEESDALVRKMRQLEQRVYLRAGAARGSSRARGITKAPRHASAQLSHSHHRGATEGALGRACRRIQMDDSETRRKVTEMGQGDADSIFRQLQAGASADISDSSGRTPLHVACSGGNVAAVRILLHMGAPVNCVDRLGNTPLTLAATAARADIVVLLLNARADPRLADGLVSAVSMVRSRLRMLRSQIRASRTDERMLSSLDDEARSRIRDRRSRAAAVARECVDIIRLLRAYSRIPRLSSVSPYTRYESAKSEASDPVILSEDAAGQLDELSSLLNSLGLDSSNAKPSPSPDTSKGKAASEHIQTTDDADSSYSNDDGAEVQMEELLDKFSLLLGDNSSKS
ncbi:hypothetical protein H4R20_001227 [Coemansia guatemalensis]|uniref:Ankyrin n=1 Tax=Coemansia guatemalensis TaxID=2761395 RepID=A0A9W8LUQ7_9FUNG|nr:hypothetical protein H4R20_001227 [Coemansia guatemalensis]